MTVARTAPTPVEIRRVALEMFASKGYHATSIRDIAQAVGIKGASMYNHFPSKEGILWALTRSALDTLRAGWEQAESKLTGAGPAARLAGFVRAHVRFHAEHRQEAALINSQLGSLSEEHFAEAAARRAEYEAILTQLVDDCLASGGHDVPNRRITVFAILQMGTAVSTWYRPDGPLTIEELCDIYATLAHKMIAGSRTEPHDNLRLEC